MKWKAGVAVIALAGLVLTGCAPKTDTGPKTELTKGTSDINPHPVEDIKDGGDFRLPLQSFPKQWNFYEIDGSIADAAMVESTAMPSVFHFDSNGEEHLNKDYVTRAELVSEDPEIVEYTIRDEAGWSDGTPITWKDFEAVWKANNGTNPAFQAGDTTGYRDVASVTRGATDKDVVVKFGKTFGEWHRLFIRLYPAAWIDTPEKFNTGWIGKIPVSAGPFTLSTDSLNPTAQTVTVARNDNWWGARAKLDTVTFRALDGNADIDAYLNNELDLVPAGATDRYGRVKDAPDTDFRKAASPAYGHLTFGSRGVFKDAATRVAVSRAVDRATIEKTMFGDLPVKVDLLNNHLFLNTDAEYADNAGDVSYDVEAAKKGLDDAGWVQVGDHRERNGEKFEATIVFTAGATMWQQTTEILQKQFEEIGLKLTVNTVPASSFFKDAIEPGNFDLTLFLWSGTGYLADGVSIFQEGKSTQNYGKVSTPEITAKLNEAMNTLDPKKRDALANEADKLIWAQGHSLPFAQSPRVNAVHSGLANIGANAANGDVDWTIVGWLK